MAHGRAGSSPAFGTIFSCSIPQGTPAEFFRIRSHGWFPLLAVPGYVDTIRFHRHIRARVKGLLGYSVVAPGFTGYVDGMHPKRLIDCAYKGRRERGVERMGKRALDLPWEPAP